jgi:hypothetical protein
MNNGVSGRPQKICKRTAPHGAGTPGDAFR